MIFFFQIAPNSFQHLVRDPLELYLKTTCTRVPSFVGIHIPIINLDGQIEAKFVMSFWCSSLYCSQHSKELGLQIKQSCLNRFDQRLDNHNIVEFVDFDELNFSTFISRINFNISGSSYLQ